MAAALIAWPPGYDPKPCGACCLTIPLPILQIAVTNVLQPFNHIAAGGLVPSFCRRAYVQLSWPQQTIYFRGMNRDEWVAPMPGLPCFTGL